MDQKKFCTNCGTSAPLEAVFCMNCGTRFPATEQIQVPVQAPIDAEATVAAVPSITPEAAPTPEQIQVPIQMPIQTPIDTEPSAKPKVNTAKQKPAKSAKKNIGLRIAATVFSVLFTILLIGAVAATAIIGSVGRFLSSENVTETINSIDVYGVVEDIVLPNYEHQGMTGFSAYMYRLVYGENTAVDTQIYSEFEKKIEDILNGESDAAKAVRSFVSEKFGDIVEDAKNGTSNAKINSEDVKALLNEIQPDVEKTFGVKIDDRDFETVDKLFEKNNVQEITFKDVKQVNEKAFDAVKLVLSDVSLYIMIAVCVLLLVAAIAVHGRYFRIGFIISGTGLMLSGAAILVPAILINNILGKLTSDGGIISSSIIRSVIGDYEKYTAALTDSLKLSGIIILASALALIVSGIIICAIVNKSKKRVQ